jgi:hypothetical protein
MNDILSGGRIDESTSGPIPSKEDDRKRDILAEQRENQRQDAIGGTEEPPRPRPPEQIPEPPQVAPPLPVIPAFDFSIAGSALEETREIARQAVVDVIKNVTINGQGPSIEGSTISFNIPQQPPASEVFLFQGVAIPQLPQFLQPLSIPQPQTPQQEPVQEIQSVVVAPPSRARVPQVEAVTEEREEVQAPQQPVPVTPSQRLVSTPVELEEPVSVTQPPEVKALSARVEVPEIEPQEPTRIPPERVVTVPTLEVEIPTVEVSEQRIEEPKVLTTPSESVATPIQEEIEQPKIVTTPTISVVPPQEEEPVEQPRITTTPSISVTVPQEEEQPQEPTPQPARSVSVQVPQTEESAIEEPQVSITTPAQQPIQLNLPESVTTPPLSETTAIAQLPSETTSIPEIPESPAVVPQATIPTVDDGLRPAPPQQTEDVTTQERPQPTSRLDAADFGAAQRDTPQRESRLNAEDFGTAQRDTPPRESRLDAEDFGTGGNENFLKPATGRLTEQESLTEKDEDSSRTGREERTSRAEQHPFFDRESDVRQHGETLSEFKERQKELESEEKESKTKEIEASDILDNESVLTRDISGPVAVSLIRADGEERLFAFVRTENTNIGEPTLPKDQYWVGVPDGENKGDLLYWDTEDTPKWKVLEAPEESEDLKVLTIRNGQLEWTDTEDCENESEE